jgi:hypothetical protein
MITPSYALTSTERVLPRLALNFTTGVLDPRITFTRASIATYTDNFGVLKTATANSPRFDHNPVTGESLGLLVEEQRTNLVLRSEQFDDSYWTKLNATVTPNTIIAPDGTLSADKLVETTSSSGRFLVSGNLTTIAGTPITTTVYAKAGERDWLILYEVASASGRFFNLSTGAKGSALGSAPTSDSIVAVGDGWYRVSITFTSVGTSALIRIYVSNANGVTSYTGDGTSGIYIYGAQFEAGALATSYIPTEATAVTRNADVATITDTNFSSFWQASRGGVLVRALPSTVSGTRPLIQFDDATADNVITLRGSTTNPELYIADGGTPQAQIDAGTIAANTAYRLAGTWATDACAASINSGTPVLDGAATIPAATQARLGSDGTNYLNGHLQSIEYYGEQVTPANLQVLSSAAGYRSMIRSLINPVL